MSFGAKPKNLAFPNVSLKARALRYLSQREHSVQELAQKLKRFIDDQNADQLGPLLDDLQQQGFLSNERYAAARIRTRSARYGNSRLTAELKHMGVTDIASHIETAETEVTRIQALISRKPVPQNFPEKAKLMRSLQLKGFSSSAIKTALNLSFQAQGQNNNEVDLEDAYFE